ncbi:MAG: RNA-binding protein [Rhodopirellula sp.]|nr:RNA-binding protein [Rhodopirellula sp.]
MLQSLCKVEPTLPAFFCCLVLIFLGCEPSVESTTDREGERSRPDRMKDASDDGMAPVGKLDTGEDSAFNREAMDREASIADVENLLGKGQLEEAASRLRALLVKDPNDVEVIFRLATVTGNLGNLEAAIDLLGAIPADHPQAGFPAVGQSADWCLKLGRYEDAEERYRQLLVSHPAAPEANRKLALIMNRRGRRHEAARYILRLCRQGNVKSDELHALMHLSDAMYDEPDKARATETDQGYFPIGKSAEARKLFMEEDYQAALDLMREDVSLELLPPALLAFYGRVAAEAQNDQEFNRWLVLTNVATQQFSEYWSAIGTFLMLQGKQEPAARGLIEALDRDPTDLRSIGRLRSLLEALGYTNEAAIWQERWETLRRILRINNQIADAGTPNTEAMIRLATELESVGRRLEANLWRLMAAHYLKVPREERRQINLQFSELVARNRGVPSERERLCGLNRGLFPLPEIEPEDKRVVPEKRLDVADSGSPAVARFTDIADEFGLNHTFHVAKVPNEYGFAVYQSIGGAVAVLDYDRDGMADLYFAQGGCDPPEYRGTESNQLFRNLGEHLQDSTNKAGAVECRYSIGVTAGDWNQDGFVDLVVGNLGANTLMINNGDGTFTSSAFDDRDDTAVMTTSLAMGDLTGDSIPDLFEVNYLDDENLPRRPGIGTGGEVLESMNPLDFAAGIDRVFFQSNDGSLLVENVGGEDSVGRAGLGVVVGRFDIDSGNQVFVANDLYANQLWNYSSADHQWLDQAMLRGCAHGFNGGSTASMGVAAGDLNGNGLLDLHVTNFQNESVSLFVNEQGFFQDRNVQFDLARPSAAVLGFGTQALDYDNDGTLDLVVANGHIEKAVDLNAPFFQPAQLFRNVGDRFELLEVADDSGYWQRDHVGRALAKLDFDRDGRQDFVVTHVGETSALLLNRTESRNHWLQLEIVGAVSERDAIGARVVVRNGDVELTGWLNAGDGFLCRNEPVLSFGVGNALSLDKVVIHWPSGKLQTFRDVRADRRYLLVEGQAELFPFGDSVD